MSSSKKLWRVGFDDSTVKPYVSMQEVFGWKVHQHILPVGSSMQVVSVSSVPRADALNRALYVGGRATVNNNLVGQLDDRVPGLFTGDRPDHPAGISMIRPVEELEFWCFNKVINRGALPDLQPVVLADGQVLDTDPGQRIFICRGQLGDHFARDAFISDGTPLVSDGDTFGFLIGGDRV